MHSLVFEQSLLEVLRLARPGSRVAGCQGMRFAVDVCHVLSAASALLLTVSDCHVVARPSVHDTATDT